jgi:hypothetical protein
VTPVPVLPALEWEAFPPHPPSEVEWEDLLVRLEIAPRALRLALAQTDPARPGMEVVLLNALVLELLLRGTLEAMAEGREAPNSVGFEGPPGGADPVEPDTLVGEIERHRLRNFMFVQRRGINVWEWRARRGFWDGATLYQLLGGAMLHDARLLAAIRGAPC